MSSATLTIPTIAFTAGISAEAVRDGLAAPPAGDIVMKAHLSQLVVLLSSLLCIAELVGITSIPAIDPNLAAFVAGILQLSVGAYGK